MRLNPPRRVRVAIYVCNVVAAPVVAYAFSKGWIGTLEMTLYSSEVAGAFMLAGLNAPAPVAVEGKHRAEG